MKTNKEKVFDFIVEYSKRFKTINDETPKLDTQFLSEKLEMRRSNLSSILNQLVDERKIEIGIFQVSIHLFQYRGDLLFPVFGFGNLYAELFSQLIDCQHIKRSFVILDFILDQVNHLG